MKIVLIHGIHSPEGDNAMSALLPHLKKKMPHLKVVLHSYGFMGFWKARWDNDRQARRLASVLEDGDLVVTHSNGAAITYLAVTRHGARPKGVLNINPALDRWLTCPVPHVETLHSRGDRAVWVSQWLPFHLWGDQGKVGYKGKLTNTKSVDVNKFPPEMSYEGHMGLFSPSRINHWANYLSYRLQSWLIA